MNLGENIYKFRTQKNLSQGDLADALDVSRQSVSKWENGAAIPDLEKLIKMCDLFGISLDELTGRTPVSTSTAPQESAQTPNQSITSGDLVSILLLLIGIILPIIIWVTGNMHDSMILLVIGMFILPPLVIIFSALCSPKNKLLFRAFRIYGILYGIFACIAGNVLAPLIGIVYIFAIGFWSDKLES